MLGYLSLDIICSSYIVAHSRLSEQIMSVDKYPCIFSRQIEAIGFIILQIFFTTRAVLKIGEYLMSHIPQFYVILDQSRASENIWWIILCMICNDRYKPEGFSYGPNVLNSAAKREWLLRFSILFARS